MSLFRTIDVQCDWCNNWVAGCVDGTPAKARRIAARNGWRYVVHGSKCVDLCPDCANKRAMSMAPKTAPPKKGKT